MSTHLTSESALVGLTLGHYRITEKIGAGGMGEVYRARDEHLDREVAIKVLPPGTLTDEHSRKRFHKEAVALSRLNHPNIATVFDFDTQQGVDFLVMEYIPGVSLNEKLAAGPLPEKEVLRLGAQLAEGLSAAHEQGVVHRDLKPGNLRLTGDARLKILDFGLAKLRLPRLESGATESFTETQSITGTLPYMAPEQLLGGEIDTRTDIHAAGAVLYEMATGRRPFPEADHLQLMSAILHKSPAPPSALHSAVSAELDRIIGKCLEKEPENRYQSARELAVDLRRLLVTETQGAAAPAVSPRRKPQISAWLAGFAAFLLACAVLLVGLNVAGLRERVFGKAAQGPGIRSVVALPSKVHGTKDNDFLAEAIPNTLSAQLTEVQGLETKMPPTSAEVERMRGDVGRIADAYGVDALVLSSVTAQDGSLIVNLQLVEARNRRLRWSHDYEGQLNNYLGVLHEAAGGLHAAILSAAPEAARAKPLAAGPAPAANSAAELSYQRGLYHWNRYNNLHRTEDFDLALSSLRRALELDPKLADAAANIGWLYEFKMESGTGDKQTVQEAELWSRRALEIDPKNSRGWSVLGVVEFMGARPDVHKTVAAGLRAAAFGPRDSFANNGLAVVLSNHSLLLTLEAARRAQELDPLYLYPAINLTDGYACLGRTTEALEQVDEVLRMEPDMPAALGERELTLIQMGRVREAQELARRLEGLVAAGQFDPAGFIRLRGALTLLEGDSRKSKPALEHLAKMWALEESRTPFYEFYAELSWLVRYGGTPLAIDATTRRFANGGKLPYDFLEITADLEPLRQDPRASKIVAQSKAQFEQLVSILEEARTRGELPPYLEKPLSDLLAQLSLEPRPPKQ